MIRFYVFAVDSPEPIKFKADRACMAAVEVLTEAEFRSRDQEALIDECVSIIEKHGSTRPATKREKAPTPPKDESLFPDAGPLGPRDWEDDDPGLDPDAWRRDVE